MILEVDSLTCHMLGLRCGIGRGGIHAGRSPARSNSPVFAKDLQKLLHALYQDRRIRYDLGGQVSAMRTGPAHPVFFVGHRRYLRSFIRHWACCAAASISESALNKAISLL